MKYEGEYTNWISFPMGGIGTGSIGLDGDGRLIDWEIFNRPSKGSYNGYTHFAIKASSESGSVTRVLNGENCINYMGQYRKENNRGYGFGPDEKMMYGFPHFTQTIHREVSHCGAVIFG